ncbi:hypothetical protein TSOC_004141 [Tetrabaena socialis]|uniref:Channelopsin 1 n=1 Tax=Tetrabaena socialis TaxID=47790 RepID=A0A2J8A9T1_9CHLO|nr:hypothetical protein TSOC_004141 [Tetrabaena socialis]|eukprot:PNH09255.1 hypothetical protein TSOC_004141 [Tetrabaena socialis]
MEGPLDDWRRSLNQRTFTDLGNGSFIIPNDGQCFCEAWLKSKGSHVEGLVANVLQWSAFGFSALILVFYAYQTWKATCGWEEIYVCAIEFTKVIIEFFHEFDEPAMLMLSSGARVQWLRYGEWLLTCPVILIHLSNLTGLKDDYNKRTMRLLVSDIGTIVWGATSAMSKGYVKIVFFLLGCCYGANTFFHAAKAYHTVPKGNCRLIVRCMAWLFFVSWGMSPILFVLGPEGFGHLTVYGSTIGHTIIDVMSKNCWGLFGHVLRVKIHEHILLHGDIRKKTKIKVAGQEMEVETLMAEEDEDTVKQPTAQYANRESFIVMRDRLKEKGFEVRASLGEGSPNGGEGGGDMAMQQSGAKAGMEMGKMGGGRAAIESGRVILAVPDISMVDFFREQFAMLPVPYELVPSLGADNTLQLVQQAAGMGGCDFVLMHPEFLRDRAPTGLAGRLRMMGQRTAAFGWAPLGPMRDLIEGASLDGWLEGPSFGAGISQPSLLALIARMQQAVAKAGMEMGKMGGGRAGWGRGPGGRAGGGEVGVRGNGMGMSGGMNGGMNTMMMGGGGGMNTMMMGGGGGMSPGGGMGGAGMMMGGGGSMGGASGMASMGGAGMMQQQMSGGGMGSMQPASSGRVIGTNPLYGSAPSPLSSQPGGGAMGGGGMSPGGGGMVGGGASEAEMLQSLMSEINRLKSELGEQH